MEPAAQAGGIGKMAPAFKTTRNEEAWPVIKNITRNPLKPAGWKLFMFLAIPVGLYLFIVITPILFSIFFSLFNWNGGPNMKFIGIENYIKTFNDRVFWLSLKNTLLFTVLMTVGQVGLAFVFTLFFTMRWVRFVDFHRTVMFFPNVISAVIIGLMWQLIYNNDIGILNTCLRALGLEIWIRTWLGDPKIAMYSLAVPVIWQYVGYYLVILMSAVGSIPKDIFEVAEIDGADGWKRSLYITIPMIWNSLKICIMICVSGSFKAFDHIMIMTGGGPGRATSVLTLYNYNVSFTSMKLGYGCAMAVVILVFSLILTIGTQTLMGGKRFES